MAQGDIFSGLFSELGNVATKRMEYTINGIQTSQAKYNKALEDALEIEASIYETKKKILKGDYEGYNLIKKMASISKSMYKGMKNAKDIGKTIKDQESAIADLLKQKKTASGGELDIINEALKRKKIDLVLTKLNQKQIRKTIPLFSSMGKSGEMVSDSIVSMGEGFKKVFGLVSDIVGFVSGLVKTIFNLGKTIFNLFYTPIKKVFDTFLQIQSTVGNLAADIGLTHQESHGLLQNMSGLALEASKYGGSMKDVATIFSEFSQTTGKNRFFSKEEVGLLTELGKGTGLGVEGAAQLAASFDNIGISLDKTIKLTDKARNMAARYNVNTTAVLKTYNELVTSLTGIGFGKGLDNLTKLAAKAQAIRFDIVKSTEAFKDAFFDPEKAAEAAAQMQVLGGKFASSFGDPMQLAFESMNDPAALAEKYADLVNGMVTKTATGDFLISPAARKQLQLAAQALGQDYENIKNTAIEQAKIADKMTVLSKAGFNLFGIKDEDKPALASLMKLNEKGQYVIKNSAGVDMLLSEMTDKNQLNAILDARKKNDKAAIERNNLAERLSLIADRFTLGFSSVMNKLFGGTDFDSFLEMVEKAGIKIAEFIQKDIMGNDGLSAKFKSILEKGENIFNKIVSIFEGPGGLGQKIGETIKTLFHDVAAPIISEVIKYVAPILKTGLGKLIELLGGALPGWLGGDKMKNAGLKMQSEGIASDTTGILSGIYGKDAQTNIANSMVDPTSSIIKTGLFEGGIHGISGAAKFGAGKLASFAGKKGAVSLFGKIGTKMGSKALSHIPVLGSLISAGFAIGDLLEGDYTGAALQGGSAIANLFPGVGTAIALGLDAADIGRELYNANQTPNVTSNAGRYDNSNIRNFIDQAAYERSNTNYGGGTASINHSGTIRIESSDGKVVTWDQMYGARDMVGASIQSVQQSYNNGFGDYHNTNTVPIKPLV